MFGPDNATVAVARPAPAAAGAPGWFTRGNPALGVPATVVDDDFLNGMLAEILSVLAAAGITPSKTATNQLLGAIQSLSTTAATTAASTSQTTARSSAGTSVAGGSDVTLTAAQASYGVITLTGALTSNINVIFPASGKWTVNNQTTGNFSATCKTPNGTGYAVRQGFAYDLYADGTNMLPRGLQTFYGTTALASLVPAIQSGEVYLYTGS